MMDAFVGEVRSFAFGLVPEGWAPCDGQIIPIRGNTALYAVLGTTYGGDGKTTFGLPNLQGAAASSAAAGIGYLVMNFCIAMQGVFPPR